jgi:hypothetical protein
MCIRTETLTKLRWYSEAETMDEGELSRRKALEEVEGSRITQRPWKITEPPARKTTQDIDVVPL